MLSILFNIKMYLMFVDEGPAFDALQTLADLSLMMPTENENGMLSISTFPDSNHLWSLKFSVCTPIQFSWLPSHGACLQD